MGVLKFTIGNPQIYNFFEEGVSFVPLVLKFTTFLRKRFSFVGGEFSNLQFRVLKFTIPLRTAIIKLRIPLRRRGSQIYNPIEEGISFFGRYACGRGPAPGPEEENPFVGVEPRALMKEM